MALREDLGNAASVADLPVGFVAQQAARRGLGELRGLLQSELGFRASEFFFDDEPEPGPGSTTRSEEEAADQLVANAEAALAAALRMRDALKRRENPNGRANGHDTRRAG